MVLRHKEQVLDARGFTLLEILFVLVIVGFLAVITLERWDALLVRNQTMAVYAAVAELNARETLVWARVKISETGWQGDASLFSEFDADLGEDFSWTGSPPLTSGGQISFQDRFMVSLARNPSTSRTPGRWTIHDKQ
jgi:prepilin-type N-terminal cleavage/methylation domain-containing protein